MDTQRQFTVCEDPVKAVVFDRYGPPNVLELREIDMPAVGDDDVLVRVRAASVNALDWHYMTGLPYLMRLMTGVRTPKCKRLGADLAGTVEQVGRNVTQFRLGDEVFGQVDGEVPGKPQLELGSFGEYVRISEECVVPKPPSLSFEQAAAVPVAGFTALQLLRDVGQVRPGQRVLINGASGGVGTFAVQIAKSLGADVTGVCSTRNVEITLSIGADQVVDYTREDFAASAEHFDVMLDNVGNRSLADCRRVLKPKAIYISSFGRPDRRWFGPIAQLAQLFLKSPFVSQTLTTKVAKRSKGDLLVLTELIEARSVAPVIDRTYTLSEVAEAMRYFDLGHAQGKVTIKV